MQLHSLLCIRNKILTIQLNETHPKVSCTILEIVCSYSCLMCKDVQLKPCNLLEVGERYQTKTKNHSIVFSNNSCMEGGA